ncbi:hypothetical protein OOK06_22470 [Streptomyces sp. NBC_00340]|uniref:hypothetical protein n=1 Tax=unclassified Streptomyces TaxID=2593676 RepID=UPI002255DA19|nr:MULTISPECIES: hypothetical protein [unclassified Streptomyces]MCX5134840.1 hypothetical protein [Streptomyces sp. NBC_00340]WSD75792.1 hypothetical protein OHB33_05460 [Streptomyces sp. NBC_01558]
MDRLLVGTPQRSNGSLTVAALAREAGVSRASVYRAGEVLELFRQRVDERSSTPDVPATLRDRIRELQGELREARRARHEESIDLRRSVDTLAQRVPALALDNERLRAELDRQGTIASLPIAPAPTR